MTLALTVLWLDDDTVELAVRCASATFAGEAACYVLPSVFEDLAAALEHFPRSAADRRDVELGTFAPDHAGGGVRLALRCEDAAGHPVLEVHVRRPREPRPGDDTARFVVGVEPAALDTFVGTLRSTPVAVGTTVTLPVDPGPRCC